jgi:hypothetical protein
MATMRKSIDEKEAKRLYEKEAKRLYNEFLKRHLELTEKSKKEFFQTRSEVQQPVLFLNAEKDLIYPTLDLRIDLRFSKNKILEQVDKIVKNFKDLDAKYFEDTVREQAEGISDEYTELVVKQWQERRLDPHYHKKRVRDSTLELYAQQLEVYDLKKSGKTFRDISVSLDYLNSPDMARDYFKAAEKYITEGPPFGPPFH